MKTLNSGSSSGPRANRNESYVMYKGKNEKGQHVINKGREKQRNTERRTN
jgi:predicted phosphodiesterase